MSEYRNSSPVSRATQFNNEEYFDLHPSPWEIEKYEITKNISIYLDINNPETFLIEIHYTSWHEAKYKEDIFRYMLRNVSLDLYRNRYKLFLRKLLF